MIDAPIPKCAIVAIVLLRSLSIADWAQAADAPYGFAWSQSLESLAEPSFMTVDANIKVLTYQGRKLPPQMTEAEVIILRVCEGFGLQQVRWFSHGLPRSEAIEEFLDIYEKDVQRYGDADGGDVDHGTAAWHTQHIRVRLEREDVDFYHVRMVSDGPQLRACQAEHDKIAGRP